MENRGLISANLGSVILASGKEAVLTFDETGLLGVQVDEAILQGELGESAAVFNTGEIRFEVKPAGRLSGWLASGAGDDNVISSAEGYLEAA